MVERADEEEGDDCGDNGKTYAHELDLNQAQQEMDFSNVPLPIQNGPVLPMFLLSGWRCVKSTKRRR